MAGVSFVDIDNSQINNLLRDAENFSAALRRKISLELEASCLTIVRNAKRMAAKNVGTLARNISYVKHDELNFEIVSASNYSGYVEFGTKDRAVIPAGYEDLAGQFRGQSIDSGGKTLKEAIYQWAEQKGIEKKLWWFIYKTIQQIGSLPHPFFIPALAEFRNLETRLRNLIEG